MRLEVGKTYLNGKNEKIKIIGYEFMFGDNFYFEGSDGHYYFKDGSYTIGIKECDLVDEVGVVIEDTEEASTYTFSSFKKVDASEIYNNAEGMINAIAESWHEAIDMSDALVDQYGTPEARQVLNDIKRSLALLMNYMKAPCYRYAIHDANERANAEAERIAA